MLFFCFMGFRFWCRFWVQNGVPKKWYLALLNRRGLVMEHGGRITPIFFIFDSHLRFKSVQGPLHGTCSPRKSVQKCCWLGGFFLGSTPLHAGTKPLGLTQCSPVVSFSMLFLVFFLGWIFFIFESDFGAFFNEKTFFLRYFSLPFLRPHFCWNLGRFLVVSEPSWPSKIVLPSRRELNF